MRLLLTALIIAACGSPPRPEPATAPPAAHAAAGGVADTVRADWGGAFERRGLTGTFVLYEPGAGRNPPGRNPPGRNPPGRTSRYNPDRAAERFVPASTFKLYNALVALETGVVGDPDSAFAWDGVERSVPAWNRDQSLRDGMRNSTVWLYQRVARRVGAGRYRAAFAREPYGNGLVGDSVETFWLLGPLAVSADEEVAFVDGLRRGALAFSPETQAAVRDLAPVLVDTAGVRLRAKTGLALRAGRPDLGWLIGWVERPDGDVVFALNAEAAGAGAADLVPARLAVAREILEGEGLLPRPAR
ncbi:penicillin-binding transpeptidase domain-containing protein [Rubrivirga litoralis]|uniref:Penicillin-binding transpeptidase domain-containing protein n=1 Tax=Rubrivirga litoralis TaxID=3075598 RepID=A0ABU3BTK2_9BACT|nr:penicillin-binding transpeptidase domain-containing protein [Rubrivirga sp. F394]MDT0632603.1 penicillin-binding transpeptidase domain-containing protein [Rubrivirga sp. F394]